ncbi:MAG: hypothetical protein ACYCZF_10525 [Anaerolineae bacterium]
MKTKLVAVIFTAFGLLLLSSCVSPGTVVPTAQVKPNETFARATVAPTSAIPVISSVADYKPQSSCDHPYYPLRKGALWVLSTADVVVNLAVTELTLAQPESVALMTRVYDFGDRYTQAWRCRDAGIYQIDVTYYSSEVGVVLPVSLITHTGLFLPKASLLSPGYSWDEFSVIQNQGTVITSTYHYQVLSTNPVTVTGQVFQGLQVVVKGIVNARNKAGEEVQQEVNLLRVFALGVGIVQENDLTLRKVVIP